MRSMSRPLAQSGLARPAAAGRPGQMHRGLAIVPSQPRESANSPTLQYRTHGEVGNTRQRVDQPHRQAHVHRVTSQREVVRRRRSNVLVLLVMAFSASMFLAATTHSNVMMYALALTFLSLCGYCYRLVQLRQLERESQHQDSTWFRVA